MKLRRALALCLMVTGCAAADPGDAPPAATAELAAPLIRGIAPTAIRAGDKLTVFGQDFVDPSIGETRLTFEGVYQTTAGKTNQVRLEVVAIVRNQGVLSWTFGPNIPFTSEEDIGSFRGVLHATNVGRDGQVAQSAQPLGLEIQVLPSVLIRRARPLGAGCDVALTATTDNTPLAFELKAVGLKSGTDIAPLRFIYTFMKEQFQLTGYLSNQLGVDPESLVPKKGPVSVVDDVQNGDVSNLGTGSPHDVVVVQGSLTPSIGTLPGALDNLFGLTQLTTAPVPDLANSYPATINVVAIDSTGQQARRAIELEVWTPIEVSYDGNSRVKRSFDPLPVSACIPGGDIGREVTYAEQSSETRTRSFKFTSTVSGGFDIKVVRLNAEFGVEVNAEVSSSTSKNLEISAKILPKEFGVFYRQTLQLERSARLIGHGGCGDTQPLGEVVVTDWTWSPDLAKSPACPPLPPSNLAPGEIYY